MGAHSLHVSSCLTMGEAQNSGIHQTRPRTDPTICFLDSPADPNHSIGSLHLLISKTDTRTQPPQDVTKMGSFPQCLGKPKVRDTVGPIRVTITVLTKAAVIEMMAVDFGLEP